MFIHRLLAGGPRKIVIGLSALSVCAVLTVVGLVVSANDQRAAEQRANDVLGEATARDNPAPPVTSTASGAGLVPSPVLPSPGEAVPDDGGLIFGITGVAANPLAPGVEQPIDLRFVNPYDFAIVVDAVDVRIEPTTSTTCSAADNVQVSRQFAGTIILPAKGAFTMSGTAAADQRPAVTMRDLAINQDDCKDTTFSFTFTGRASKP